MKDTLNLSNISSNESLSISQKMAMLNSTSATIKMNKAMNFSQSAIKKPKFNISHPFSSAPDLRKTENKRAISVKVGFEYPTQPQLDTESTLFEPESEEKCSKEVSVTKKKATKETKIFKNIDLPLKLNDPKPPRQEIELLSSKKRKFFRIENLLKRNNYVPKAQRTISIKKNKREEEYSPLSRVDEEFIIMLEKRYQEKGEELSYEDLVKLFFPKGKVPSFKVMCNFRIVEKFVMNLA